MAKGFVDPKELPLEYPRRFLPPDLPAGDWKEIAPFFEDLEKRKLHSPKDLEQAFLDLSELLSAVEEEGAIRYIRMTCDTTNPEYEKAYLAFVEEVAPKVEEALQRLRVKFASAPAWKDLDPKRYLVLKRKWENAIVIFREENIPLKVEEEKLGQRYQKIFGAMTVEFEGHTQTLQQMAKYLEEPDRRIRKIPEAKEANPRRWEGAGEQADPAGPRDASPPTWAPPARTESPREGFPNRKAPAASPRKSPWDHALPLREAVDAVVVNDDGDIQIPANVMEEVVAALAVEVPVPRLGDDLKIGPSHFQARGRRDRPAV